MAADRREQVPAAAKAPEAFRTISEVSDILETPPHVLRFWESKFSQLKPVKRAGGRRYYRPADLALLGGIKRLLHDEGMTIRGVQKMLREHGPRHVATLAGPEAAPMPAIEVLETAPPPPPDTPHPASVDMPAPPPEAPGDSMPHAATATPAEALPEPRRAAPSPSSSSAPSERPQVEPRPQAAEHSAVPPRAPVTPPPPEDAPVEALRPQPGPTATPVTDTAPEPAMHGAPAPLAAPGPAPDADRPDDGRRPATRLRGLDAPSDAEQAAALRAILSRAAGLHARLRAASEADRR